jgi:molybdopterin/thiamine biosynthesis adenylyltransferase
VKEIKCDRCNNPISLKNESVRDFINKRYPGKDICEDCDLTIELAKNTTARDIEENLPIGTTIQRMLNNYK